ncbi:MAG TPA: hypothetical protein DHV14_07545 [Micrococcales bacterium]|uniref:maleylpyruvate isomerase family mycothiol-dependent enzyme n=1 Tax=Miniimonas arenae TaxID=676201 RepID=UPI000EC8ABBA|nr:maleylpyruvate isomerase family mycothiol-dependent enzyme [Miniimonas arenae]HCX84973.1 hypothetical protein [Micrococcales bacterium]
MSPDHPPRALPTDLLDLLDLQARFLATVPLVDPDEPVPSCGTWRVRDLVTHLVEIHRWAAAQAARLPEPPPDAPLAEPVDAPVDLACHYRAGATELADVLRRLDADAPAWTLLDDSPGDAGGTVAFWHRRQKSETLVHLWDLRTATGLDTAEVPDAWWLDCVDEAVTVMHPRQIRLARIAPPPIALTLAADGEHRWTLSGAPPGAPAVSVTGPAPALALLLWGRTSAHDPSLAVGGDPDGLRALDALLATSLTP